MRKIIYSVSMIVAVIVTVTISCQKSENKSESNSTDDEPMGVALTPSEQSLVKAAGLDETWAERRSDGNYLIEGDILLSKAQLESMAGVSLTNNFITGKEEHYRTYNLVNTYGGVRTVTVSLSSGFPAYYSDGLNQALAHYNTLNLNIRFQRVASGGEIQITGANLGRTAGGGCILGQSAGFPDANGNPAPGFKLSTTKCATQYINTAAKADEVMAHEIGHCIGFRHTDYVNRISCGSNSGEGDSGIGAVYIPGTPTNVSASYDSWMMACTNGDPKFNADDVIALQYVY